MTEEQDQETLTNALCDLLTRHGLQCALEGAWVVPHGRLPAIRATWRPENGYGRLDVEVLLAERRIIRESFGGIGESRAGLGDALNNFMHNSLHVLLASLWDVDVGDHAVRETWHVGGRQFTACIGHIGIRAIGGPQVVPPKDLFGTIRDQICKEDLSAGLHWFRVFFASHARQHSYEALLDNEPWDAGVSALKAIAWPSVDGYYSFRNFIVLRQA